MAVRKTRQRIFDEFFDDLVGEMEEIEKNISAIFKELRDVSLKTPDDESYSYGFSMHIGPDGRPHIEEFGDIPRTDNSQISESMQKEPLVEVIDGEKEISAIIELSGIEKNDIKLDTGEDKVEIDVSTIGYHKVINLPCGVKPETTKATYKNGVLEIKIQRSEKKVGNIRVNVE